MANSQPHALGRIVPSQSSTKAPAIDVAALKSHDIGYMGWKCGQVFRDDHDRPDVAHI
jgi:hypothetical protein